MCPDIQRPPTNALSYLANRLVRISSNIIEYPYPRRAGFSSRNSPSNVRQQAILNTYRSLRFSTSDICVATTSPGLGGDVTVNTATLLPPASIVRRVSVRLRCLEYTSSVMYPPMLRRTPNRCLMSQPARETRQLCRAHPECQLPTAL